MKTVTPSTATTASQPLPPILMGLCWSFGFVLLATVLTTLVLQYSSISDSRLPAFSLLANAVGVLLGGYVTARFSGNKGLLAGAMTGVTYGLIMLLIGFLGFDYSLRWEALMAWVCMMLLGGIGGVLGVNLRS